MDIRLLQAVVAELAEKISAARIAKIHQPAAELVVFRLWTGQQNLKLLISAEPGESRIYLTEQSFPNPFTPPRFCQLLRARLTRIVRVRQVNDDRIVEIMCQGPKGDCRLLVELTGKSSNLVLVDGAGTIIDALKRSSAEQERIIAAGVEYSYPSKKNRQRYEGSEKSVKFLDSELRSMAVEKLYTGAKALENKTNLSARLRKVITKERQRLQKRQKNIERELNRQQDFEQIRQRADLLLSAIHLLKRGMSEITVSNYYQQPPVDEVIALNPLFRPQENIEKYYRKYKKARRGLEHGRRRRGETEAELNWLAELEYQLENNQHTEDMATIADELRKAGILKEKVARLPRISAAGKRPFHELVSPNGFKIFWGSNSRQNDALSTRVLKKGDLWFHAHRCPGSHVVLKMDAGLGLFMETDILFAASIAAANSKACSDTKVEVMLAEPKQVKKPPGAKPGMVTVQNYRTLMVEPYKQNPDIF